MYFNDYSINQQANLAKVALRIKYYFNVLQSRKEAIYKIHCTATAINKFSIVWYDDEFYSFF